MGFCSERHRKGIQRCWTSYNACVALRLSLRAHVIVPNLPAHDDGHDDEEEKKSVARRISSGPGTSRSGWISLLNALTGSSGALPVPLGAYVVVSEPGGCMTNSLSELKVIFEFFDYC